MRLPRLNPNSLRTKIIAWSFIPTLIILTGVAWYTFYAYQRVTSELVVRQDQELVELRIQQLTRKIIEVFNPVLVPLLFEPNLADPDDSSHRDAILTSAEIATTFDGGVLMTDEHGVVLSAYPERPDLGGYNWSSEAHFKQSLELPGRGTFSEIKAIGPGGSDVVTMTMSVRMSSTGRSAVMIGLMRITPDENSTINRIFQAADLGENVYVVDKNGRVIYHPDPAKIGADLSEEPTIQRALRDEPAGGQSYDAEGNPLVTSYAPVFVGGDWIMIKEQALVDLMAPSRPYTSMLLALLAMGVVIPSIVVSYGLRRILKPVDDLIAATQDIAGGNFGKKIPVESSDELAELANQFNRMSEELEKSYSLLEQRVEERTRQLATLNAISAVVSRSLELEEVLCGALEEITASTPFEVGAAYQEENGRMERVTACGLSEDARAAFDQYLQDQAALTSLNIQRTSDLPQMELRRRFAGAGIGLTASLPLMAKGKRLGMVLLGAAEAQDFSAEDQALLRSIGEQVAVAVENARLYARAEETAVAEERSRLARDLHDAVTQTLFSTALIAEALPQIYEANPSEGRRRAEELHQLTRGALAEMRTLLLELRPHALAEARLEDLLRQLADAAIGRARIPVHLHTEGSGRLPAPVQVALYRIAQEALNNAVKHAHASQINLTYTVQPGSVRLAVKDDGAGFDPAAVQGAHFGVSIMRERAAAIDATLTIETGAGQGTEIRAEWKAPA